MLDSAGATVVMSCVMIRRAVWGAPVFSLLGCAASAPAAPPRTAVDVTAPSSFVDARPAVERARPARAAGPPGTRGVGVNEWSFAIGEDWQHRDHGGGRQYALSHGQAGSVVASVGRDPRPRGAASDAYRDVLADLLGRYGEAGVRVVSTRTATVGALADRARQPRRVETLLYDAFVSRRAAADAPPAWVTALDGVTRDEVNRVLAAGLAVERARVFVRGDASALRDGLAGFGLGRVGTLSRGR